MDVKLCVEFAPPHVRPRDADAAQRRPEGRGGSAGKRQRARKQNRRAGHGDHGTHVDAPFRAGRKRRLEGAQQHDHQAKGKRHVHDRHNRHAAGFRVAVRRAVYPHMDEQKSQMTGAYGLEKPHAPPLRAKRVHCSTPRGPAAGSTALRSKAYGSAHHYLPRSLAHGSMPLPHGQALEACAPSIRKNFAHEPVWGQEVEGDPLELHPFGAFRWPFVAT